ncbi:MAG: hypothetical protein ACE5EO_04955 [Candidatus Krumholzibacteriia bacterium]
MKAKKQLAMDKRDVREFGELLAEMDALRLPRQMRDFWAINANVRSAMKREYEQTSERAGKDGVAAKPAGETPQEARMSGTPNYLDAAGDWQAKSGDGAARLPAPARAGRMKAVIVETDGLQRIMAAGEMDVMERYRYLLGVFLELMGDEVDAAAAALDATRK